MARLVYAGASAGAARLLVSVPAIARTAAARRAISKQRADKVGRAALATFSAPAFTNQKPARLSRRWLKSIKMVVALAALPLLASGCTGIGTSVPAGGVRQVEATVIMPLDAEQRSFQEEWGFAEAVVVGDTIYLSGIIVDKLPADTDLAASYERTYREIGAILARAGASWDDVVDISSFHTDVKAQIRPMVSVHKRFVRVPYPAWTAIGGAQMLGDGITEIKIVAKRPARARKARLANPR